MRIGYLAAASGITTAINWQGQRQAAASPSSFVFNPAARPDAVIAEAGLLAADWDALVTALGGANAVNIRKLLNAAGLVVAVETAPFAKPHNHGGAIADPVGGKATSALGDLS